MGELLPGPWSSHPFRGQHVVMFRTRRGWGWDWGKLHLVLPGQADPRCGTPKPSKIRDTWRSHTANPAGWNPGAYSGEFSPCRRCLRLLESD